MILDVETKTVHCLKKEDLKDKLWKKEDKVR